MNVGDYVRTKNGSIFKIIGGNEDDWDIDIEYSKLEYIEDNWLELYRYNDNHSFFNNKNIIKTSSNIIDLIEIGDYVNGEKVIRLFNPTFLSMGELPYVITDKNKYEPQEIETIVTKEQFESMEYKVGE